MLKLNSLNQTTLYRLGGFPDDNGQGQATLPAYNIEKDQWQSVRVSGGNLNRFDRIYSLHASSTEGGGSLSFVSGGQDYVGGMVTFNSTNPQAPSWRNSTNADLPYFWGGVSAFVRYGTAGILVSVGGFVSESTQGAVAQRREMNSVQVYDVAEDKWSTIFATGDAPPPRSRFCSAMSAATDDSSFVLTIHGGWDEENTLSDVYQLIMPAFHWIKINTTASAKGDRNTGRMDAFCSAPGNGRQMLVLGGQSELNPESTKCDQKYPALRSLDLTTFQWQTTYSTNNTKYSVPKAVSDIVGGGPEGGGRPAGWWSQTLGPTQALFEKTIPRYDPDHPPIINANVSQPVTNTTAQEQKRVSNEGSIGRGAIVGAIVGGVAGFAIIIVAVWFLILWRRRAKKSEREKQDTWKEPVEWANSPQHGQVLSEAEGDSPLRFVPAEMNGIGVRAELPGARSR